MATHSSVLAWRIQGWGSLVGCRLWGCTESDMTEVRSEERRVEKEWVELGENPSAAILGGVSYFCFPSKALSGKESAQGCLPKRLLGRPD